MDGPVEGEYAQDKAEAREESAEEEGELGRTTVATGRGRLVRDRVRCASGNWGSRDGGDGLGLASLIDRHAVRHEVVG
jgi:hypothetical protein